MRRGLLVLVVALGGCLASPPTQPTTAGDAAQDAADRGEVPGCRLIGLTDNFSDGGWIDDWNGSWEESVGMLRQGGGEAIIVPTTSPDTYAAFETDFIYDLTDACAHIEVTRMLAYDAQQSAEVWFGVETTEGQLILSEHAGLVCCQVRIGGDTEPVGECPDSYQPTLHRWWRIRVSGDEFACDTSMDGSRWQDLAVMPLPFDVSVAKVSVMAGTWESVEAPGEVHFDNVDL